MSKMYEAATVKTKNLGNYKKSLETHNIEHKQQLKVKSPQEIVMYGQNHVVKVTVEKTKGQKRTSSVTSYSSGQKVEKKRSTTNTNETSRSWGDIFRQQNLLHMKEQSSKHSEDRKTEKNINATTKKQNTTKYSMKSEQKRSTTPCCSSIFVQDCATQCEIYDSNTLAEFNPIHMLHLIKQLKDLVNKKDKRTCEIFIEMEQILQKDLETKVESNAVPSKESSKKMKTMSYEWFEQEKLQSEIQQRDEQLKEVHQKYAELEVHAKLLTEQLDKITYKKDDIISMLTQQIANDKENNKRIITDLKTNLDKQTELAQQNYINNKYLTLEIDKLSALSSYKDIQITDYRNTIKELQNQIEQITKQFKIIHDTYFKETSPQISLINTGHACSSPTSSFSDGSNKSWHDLSDISSVDSVPKQHVLKEDAPVRDLELVSLLDGESSHSILPDQNEVINNKGSIRENNNENDTIFCQNTNTNDVTTKKFLPNSSKKSHNKENDIYEMRKFTRLKENQNDNIKNLFLNASSTALESITSTKSTVSDIRKQSDMQNRKPINVPSPLRDYPHPDWSDSSLPSISTVSNLDVIPSNDI